MKLIFVYNANGGKFNAYLDSAHKIFSPSTYACSLCAITYGVFKIEEVWKDYKNQSTDDLVFLHKDEFLKEYKSKFLPKFKLPIILTEAGDNLEIFISAEELDKMKNAEELIKTIAEKKAHY